MVIPSEHEEKANFTLKWVTKKRTNTTTGTPIKISRSSEQRFSTSEANDPNLTPKRNMESEINQAADARASKKQTTIATPRTNGGGEVCCGIEAARPRLVIHLKTNRTKDVTLNKEKEYEQRESAPAPKNLLRWNLRTRGGKCEKANELKKDEKKQNCSLSNNSDSKMQRAKLRIELSKKEIEEDFMAMLGHPLPRKPNKRPKVVQNQLDNLFPGLYIKEITANSYKVPESSS